ncbi:type I polyketide synthase [Scytonema sp. HK-05]|uniref:type I polyketide synthase n=1 Tax=Scytonema sp. HK-05 TaxID=1137095 RepID=UPI001E5635B3|nr:type I polyketide synthase [Scytonema sp. HK-05]
MLTIVDVLRNRALSQQEQRAYTFLQDGERELNSLTYGELDRISKAIAAQLQSMGASGQRALLLYPSGLEFIAAFFGCLYAGVVAVPAYPPRANQKMSRLEAIIADAEAQVILTTEALLPNIKSRVAQNPELAALSCLATDNIDENQADSWQETPLCGSTLAFLQYTSGSTGTPKGVMVSHENLMHNEKIIQHGMQHTEKTIFVGWLPLFHDMGLIGNMLQPLYLGIPCILMSPEAFLQKPFRWLQAISRYKATTSGGPNFAYDLCVNKITDEQRASLDLSSWQVAFNGAEPVRAETMARFTAAFANCGFRREAFYPCYGMAETTLIVSGGRVSAQPIVQNVQKQALEQNRVVPALRQNDDSQTLVGSGECLPELEIVIANPQTMEPCQPNEVGEIWVSGPSIAQGYWNRQEQTEQTFRAQLRDTKARRFLRTGDLGFLLNGELFVTGRLKDVIIIRGRNYYPQDIELTVEQSHPALRSNAGAAFSVDIAGEEKLVVAQEVERSYLRKLNANEVIGSIRRAIAQQHDLEVYAVLLLKTVSLPKTSSGKVQRSACRAKFLAGTLDIVADWSPNPKYKTNFRDLETEVELLLQQLQTGKLQPEQSSNNHSEEQASNQQVSPSQEAIEAWLISKISKQLASSDEIDIRQPLVQYGLSSLAAVGISGDLQEWLGRELSPTLLYDYPTIESLARYLAGLETGHQQDAHRTATTEEAIAIIGIGCRFPGAKGPETFWQLLHDGVDAVKEVSPSRWDMSRFSNKTTAEIEEKHTQWGGFLEQVDQFDPQFFGIAPREAELMDPQQRLLLEVSWEALENAGQTQKQVAGSQTGVFIGISNYDYSRLVFNPKVAIDPYSGTGNALSIAANRLSYVLDLRGPSWAVDTACSSSLVAVHQACQSLQQGECQMALAGGVNLILSPEVSMTFSKAGMIAVDGRCKTFDAKANGYVRGEGCGVVVLKRVSDAVRDGDTILAVIRGSAVNQDGRSNGLTAPNPLSQQAVISHALENAKVQPAQINYVEAHGTGTSLGDPIELNSLKDILMQGRSPDEPCWIGSVKTNIGHLEAAAGIASLIKVVLSLQHKEIPPHLHLEQINPYISIDGTPLSIPTKLQKWATGKEPRLAGVSSFGFGGTNAHVVLEEAPPEIQNSKSPKIGVSSGDAARTEVSSALTSLKIQKEDKIERQFHLLTLSAKSEKALGEMTQRYADFLTNHPEVSLADVCYTANTGRSHFNHRLAVVAKSSVQLQEALNAFADSRDDRLVNGQVSNKRQKIAFLFTGQGSQYVGMGRQLYENAPVFRAALDQCDEILRPYLGQSLLQVLYPKPEENSPLDQTAYTQPALFAIEYALVQLWKSWGIHPDAVMGHSVGEYVAATVAGVLSLEDGLKLIAHRSRLMQSLPADGEMVAVFADEKEIREVTKINNKTVAFAAFNGSGNTVISGSAQAVQAVCVELEAAGIKTKKLQTSHAFHSPLMEPILAQFAEVAATINYAPPQITIISNLTGSQLTFEEISPDYWCRHLRSGVQFAKSINTLHASGYEVFVEIGSKPTLLGMGRNCLSEQVGVWLPSLRPGHEDWRVLLQSLGELYVRGADVDWSGFDQDYGRRRVMLPTYPFQRQRYWVNIRENEHSQAGNLFQEKTQSPIMKLLSQGDTQQVVQNLEKAGELSENELQLLPKLLQLLIKQDQQLLTASIKDWLYEVQWQQLPRDVETRHGSSVQKNGIRKAGTWLIFADLEGVGQTLAKLLRSRGNTCILVYPGNSYNIKEGETWSINPYSPVDFEFLFQKVLGMERPLQGIVHLWSLEAELAWDLTVSSLEQAQTFGVGSVLHLLQAVIKKLNFASASPLPRLWLVTRGAVPAGSELPGVAQASLWGLGKVVALEHPELWGGMLDLAPNSTNDEAKDILAEIEDSLGEDHIALRNGNRYVARLVPKQQEESKQVTLRSDGTYLITGGLGALGLKVAHLLVSQGARQLVLTGRNTEKDEAQSTLRELEQLGAKIFLQKVDVSDEADMVRLLETVQATMPPLRGIVHAAGVLDDGILQQQSWERFSKVMAPKVRGAWNLHTLTDGLPLDFFVVFSSAASLLGSPGQGNYAAANSFMDALAHHRRLQGLPGLSINWGPWAEVGMAASLANHQQAANAMGLSSIAPDLGLQVLKQVLLQASSQVGVLPIDWLVLRQQLSLGGQLPPLFFELFGKTKTQAESDLASVQPSDILQKLQAAPASDRLSLLTAYIQGEVAKVLKFASSQLPDPKQNFFDMGMDSLTSVEFKNHLQNHFGRFFPSTLVFNYPNINALVQYLSQEVLSLEMSAQASQDLLESQEELTTSLEELKQLSESEVMVLISQEFEAYR